MLNKKQIFEKVKKHLLVQNEKARNKEGNDCAYWNKETGLKCAVGCLIKPECYSEDIEGIGLDTTITYLDPKLIKALDCSGIPTNKDTLRLLSQLQGIHDNIEVNRWKSELDKLEKEMGV